MAELVLLHPGEEYGAVTLKEIYRTSMRRGLITAVVLHLLGVGIYWVSVYGDLKAGPPTPGRRTWVIVEPSPSMTNPAPTIAVSGRALKQSMGIPVPVPEAEVDPDQTISTQEEMSQVGGSIGEATGNNGTIIEETPPPPYVSFEKEPVLIKRAEPVYPEMARRAFIEGTVWVSLWVDKEGKVHKAVIMKSDAETLNQAALDAARQFLFIPAMQYNGPVAVWVSIQFRFKLSGR